MPILSQMKYRENAKRSQSGASLLLIIACAFGLVLLIYGLFQLSMIMGGSRQVRNAVDAGALNVSKKMMEIRVTTDPKYADVSDTNGKVGMSNVNRLWGKAYLINANLEEMQKSGRAGPSASSNGDTAYQLAQNVNDQLFNELASSKNQDIYFHQMAGRRTANLINPGMGIDRTKTASCPIALVDRGDESNLTMQPTQIPEGVEAGKVDKGSKSYMQGYVPMTANNKKFTFTSFHEGEQPHLISDSLFDASRADKAPLDDKGTTIPNAFRQFAEASNGQTGVSAVASAVANPIRTYDMAIPQSYITIHVTNISIWNVDNKFAKAIPYNFKQQRVHGLKDFQTPTRVINCFGTIGGEYQAGSSINVILNALKADINPAMKKLLQRIQCMDPKFTKAKLVKLFEQQQYDPKVLRYYIFAADHSADHTDPNIQMVPENGSLPPWIDPKQWDPQTLDPNLDGISGTPLVTEPTTTDQFAQADQSPGGTPQPYATNTGVMMWKPGTGFNKAVGDLYVQRLTQLYFSSKP